MQCAYLSAYTKSVQHATKCAPPRGPLDFSHFLCIERISILRPHILLAAVTPVTSLQAVLQGLS